jgi:hypothetical protein
MPNIQPESILESTCNDQRQKRVNAAISKVRIIIKISPRNTTLLRDDLKSTLKLNLDGIRELFL